MKILILLLLILIWVCITIFLSYIETPLKKRRRKYSFFYSFRGEYDITLTAQYYQLMGKLLPVMEIFFTLFAFINMIKNPIPGALILVMLRASMLFIKIKKQQRKKRYY